MGEVQSDGTAGAVYWQSQDDAWLFAQKLAVEYGRPIVTGIFAGHDEQGGFIRVDFHGMVTGDTHLILRCEDHLLQVRRMYQHISESNKAEIIADRERMNAAYEAAQEKKKQRMRRSLAAKAAWRKRKGLPPLDYLTPEPEVESSPKGA